VPHGPWAFRSLLQLSIIGTAFGSQIVNVHHFEASADDEADFTNDQTAQAAGLTFLNGWVTGQKDEYLGCVSSDYQMVMLRAQILERPGLREHRLTPSEVPSSGAGTGGVALGTAENAIVSGVVRWRTPQAGKHHRGRTYFGPIAAPWQSNGLLVAAGVTALTAYKDVMVAAYGQTTPVPRTTWCMTIYSKPFDHGEYGYPTGRNPTRTFFYPQDYNGNSTNVTTGAVDPVLRNQRRRQIGVGA
jgi:hypothetical protein